MNKTQTPTAERLAELARNTYNYHSIIIPPPLPQHISEDEKSKLVNDYENKFRGFYDELLFSVSGIDEVKNQITKNWDIYLLLADFLRNGHIFHNRIVSAGYTPPTILKCPTEVFVYLNDKIVVATEREQLAIVSKCFKYGILQHVRKRLLNPELVMDDHNVSYHCAILDFFYNATHTFYCDQFGYLLNGGLVLDRCWIGENGEER